MEDKDFKEIRELGRGAYGVVHLVEHNGQLIARKSQKVRDEEDLKIDVLKKLHNRYLIHYYGYYQKPKKEICILMEYCPNKNLHDLLLYFDDKKQYLSNNGVLKYFCEMVIGLQYLHNHKILHRDLKPDNIFITKDNVCVLADFGLAKEVTDLNALNRTQAGTPLYMAPEIMNNGEYSYKAEIWSLGCILHELCSLHPLYSEAKSTAGLLLLQDTEYDKLKLKYPLPQHIDKGIRDIIKWCLNKDPEKRPTMNELYNHEVIQKFINKTGRSLLFEYDTAPNDNAGKSQHLIDLINELTESLKKIEEKSRYIVGILNDYEDEKTIDKQDECSIFKLIQCVSSYIGRTLLINPHSPNPKYQYYRIDTYDRMKKNIKKDSVINIINAIMSFLSKHSFREELEAIYEGLKSEGIFSDDVMKNWERLLKSK